MTAVVTVSSSRWYRPSAVDAESAPALRCRQAESLRRCYPSTLPLGDGCHPGTHMSPLLQAKGCHPGTRLTCTSYGKLGTSLLVDEHAKILLKARRLAHHPASGVVRCRCAVVQPLRRRYSRLRHIDGRLSRRHCRHPSRVEHVVILLLKRPLGDRREGQMSCRSILLTAKHSKCWRGRRYGRGSVPRRTLA